MTLGRRLHQGVETLRRLETDPVDADQEKAGGRLGWAAQAGGNRVVFRDAQPDAAGFALAAGGGGRRSHTRLPGDGARPGRTDRGEGAGPQPGRHQGETGSVEQSDNLSS